MLFWPHMYIYVIIQMVPSLRWTEEFKLAVAARVDSVEWTQ